MAVSKNHNYWSIFLTFVSACIAAYVSYMGYRIDAETRKELTQTSTEFQQKKLADDQLIRKTEIYTDLITNLTDSRLSSFALLALWQLAETEKEKRVILATALTSGPDSIVALKNLIAAGENVEPQIIELYESASNAGNDDLVEAIESVVSFDQIIGPVIKREGGYFYSIEGGEEVFAGISRKLSPDWRGWLIVDSSREESGFPSSLNENVELITEVNKYFETNFWRGFGNLEIKDVCIAQALLDFSTNSGMRNSIKTLQRSLFLEPNGVIDRTTKTAVMKLRTGEQYSRLYHRLIMEKIRWYSDLVSRKASYRKFYLIWIKRMLLLDKECSLNK